MNNRDAIHKKTEFTNVRQLIEWAAETYGEKYAYSYKEDPLHGEVIHVTFTQLRDDVRALASRLLRMGCAGRHCVVTGKPSYEWILVYFAVLSVGGVLVPLDRDWLADDLADTASRADAAYLFCDEDLAGKADAVASRTNLEHSPVYLLAKEKENSLSALLEDGRALFEESPEAYFNTPIDPVKMSLLVFTSGTTGKGKGVMLSQNAVLSNMADAIPYIDFSDKTVGVLPLHHTYGSTVMLIAHIMIGCENYISAGLRYVQKELREQKPGHLVLVPLYLETFYRRIMANLKEKGKEQLVERMIKVSNGLRKAGIDRRSTFFKEIRAAFGGELKTVITGGAPVNPQILEFFDAIGISTLNGYGITECAPLISVNRSRNIVPGTVGNVLDMDIVTIDEPNEDGEGEILVKGPNVMLGYYKDEQATADAFDRGYFRTGDYGTLTDAGILTITGRKKNLIILSNGKNVYPEEIENELAATPGILDIIVYEGQSRRGISHNAIVAEVYPDTDFMNANGITDVEAYLKPYVDAFNRKTVPYKKIAVLKIRRTEFPKNTLRKIMRFQLDMTID
ncbi:MAG: AMP-binding protein [Clostridia bacterium]|nr:AMP-binding protein [Clostridia bacterium]